MISTGYHLRFLSTWFGIYSPIIDAVLGTGKLTQGRVNTINVSEAPHEVRLACSVFDNCIGRCHKGGCIRLNLLHLNEKYVAKLHTIGHCTTLVSVPLVILTRNCDYCTGALVCLGRFTPLIMSGTVSKLKLPVADGLNAN